MTPEMEYFLQSRFGMFIHWGIYAAAEGRWQGMDTPGITEWMMRKFQIPRAEYRKLAAKFTGDQFDADAWVRAMYEAGMKYVVITAKHHDGFAMYRTTYDDYNIVDATPFGRDPMAELAAACEKYGIKLGFYYSHEQDWNEAGATGNTWDFTPEEKTPEAFEKYLQTKVRHQLREILTNYGKIFALWLDTPQQITEQQCWELRDFIRELAPECLVNSRIGKFEGMWDFKTLPDNHIPPSRCLVPTEAIGTMNESWGYKPYDLNYRTTEQLLHNLAKSASCDANYMLNVGPDARGAFPPEALERLRQLGEFVRPRGEALYGTRALEMYINANRWGYITKTQDALYFWCFTRPEYINFYGLCNSVKKAQILTGNEIVFDQDSNDRYNYHRLTLQIPSDAVPPFIIKAECDGEIKFNLNTYSAGTF